MPCTPRMVVATHHMPKGSLRLAHFTELSKLKTDVSPSAVPIEINRWTYKTFLPGPQEGYRQV